MRVGFIFSFLSIGLIFKVSFCIGQEYIPIPLDSNRWHILVDYNLQFSCHEQHVFEYGLNSDGMYSYKKVTCDNFALFFHDYGNPYCSIYSFMGGRYFGAVRQDTITKKVFFIPQGSNADSLLYDFNLMTGDTFFSSILVPYQMPCNDPFDIVTSVDSVLIGTVHHRRWNFNCIQPIIDGIGSVFNPFGTNPDGFYLTCVSIGNSIYSAYGWGGVWDSLTMESACNFVAEAKENPIFDKGVKLEPNPFFESLITNIEDTFFTNGSLEIFNATGIKIFEIEITHSTQVIELNSLLPGIYFFNLLTEKYNLIKKVIKIN